MADATSLIAALRKAPSAADMDKSLSAALDLLISTPSVASTQQLLAAVVATWAAHAQPGSALIQRLQLPVSVCTAPLGKVKHLGFMLVRQMCQSVSSGSAIPAPDAIRQFQCVLVEIQRANPDILLGVLTAMEAPELTSPSLITCISIARPLLIATLIDQHAAMAHKFAVLHELVRCAWTADGDDDDEEDQDGDLASVKTPAVVVSELLMRALLTYPQSVDASSWLLDGALVASTVDLLQTSPPPEASATAVAHALLRRISFGISHQLGVTSLLQSLLVLASCFPRALRSSTVLWSCGSVLVMDTAGPADQKLMLQVLRTVLMTPVTWHGRQPEMRDVYVESLVVPLVSVLPTHSADASTLLQRVMEILTTVTYTAPSLLAEATTSTATSFTSIHEAPHAASFIALVGSLQACHHWLQSLFVAASDTAGGMQLVTLQLGAMLVDRRGSLRIAALDAVRRRLDHARHHRSSSMPPSTTKLLVSTLLFLTSWRAPSYPATATTALTVEDTKQAEWMSRCFQVLAPLAATTTETMKIILRLIKRMQSVPAMRAQALHLQLLVWQHESRVYPQLETMLQATASLVTTCETHGDAPQATALSNELAIVRTATILAICEKDPECGVEWIAEIQRFLESDAVGVASMAVRAVTRLCTSDCLDMETTIKILTSKMKKKRIPCVNASLFQQELCHLYAHGAQGGFMETSPRYGGKVVDALWELAEAEDSDVRREAFAALSGFSLAALGLGLADDGHHVNASANDEVEDEDEDAWTQDDVDEAVERLWAALTREADADVRRAMQPLLVKLLDAECKQVTPGSSRGGRGGGSTVASFSFSNRVSSAATKEMKKQIPTRSRILEELDAVSDGEMDWRSYLLAYAPVEAADTAANKRKDKRMRVVSTHVEDMSKILLVRGALDAPLRQSSGEDDVRALLDMLLWMEAWVSFMQKLLESLEELAELKTPTEAAHGHTDDVLASLVGDQIVALLERSKEHDMTWLAVGALAGQATVLASRRLRRQRLSPMSPVVFGATMLSVVDTAKTALRHQLSQSIQEVRVLKDADQEHVLVHVLLGLLLVHTMDEPSLCEDLALVTPLMSTESHHALVRSVATLCASHIGSVLARGLGDPLAARVGGNDGVTIHHRRTSTKALTEAVLRTVLRSVGEDGVSVIRGEVFPIDGGKNDSSPALLAASEITLQLGNSTDRHQPNWVTLWASLMGLARLSQGMAALQRVSWLRNLRTVLTQMRLHRHDLPIAVALGPVLVECVRYHAASSSDVHDVVADLVENFPTGTGHEPGALLSMLPLAFLQSRLDVMGCDLVAARVDTSVKQLESMFEGETGSNTQFGSVAAINWMGAYVGVVVAPLTVTEDEERETRLAVMGADVSPFSTIRHELTWETSDVQRVLLSLHSIGTVNLVERAALSCIVDRAGGIYVRQRSKLFDVEVQALPHTNLVFKTLNYIRSHASCRDPTIAPIREQDEDDEEDEPLELEPEVQIAATCETLLHSLAKVTVLPPLDLCALVRRVMVRFADAHVRKACLELAAVHPSCVEFLVTEVFAPTYLLNTGVEVPCDETSVGFLGDIIDAVAVESQLLSTEQVEIIHLRLFSTLVAQWEASRATPSSFIAVIASKWINLLSKLVQASTKEGALVDAASSAARSTTSSHDAKHLATCVSTLVLTEFLPRLPFDPDSGSSTSLLARFAVEVLAKCDPPEGASSVVDHVLELSKSSSSMPAEKTHNAFAWWRSGVLLSALASAGITPPVGGSHLFLWLLQQRFVLWTHVSDRVRDQLVYAVSGAIVAAVGHAPKAIGANESWLLEVMDAFARTLRTNTDDGDMNANQLSAQRRACLLIVSSVIVWTQLDHHERFLISAEGLDELGSAAFHAVERCLPYAFASIQHSRVAITLWERLWALHTQVASLAPTVAIGNDLTTSLETLTRSAIGVHVEGDLSIAKEIQRDVIALCVSHEQR